MKEERARRERTQRKGEERFRREEEKAATATEITTKSTEPDQGR